MATNFGIFFEDTHFNLFQRIFFKVLMGPQIWENHCKYRSKSMNNNWDEYFRNIIENFENNFRKPLIEQFLKKSCTPLSLRTIIANWQVLWSFAGSMDKTQTIVQTHCLILQESQRATKWSHFKTKKVELNQS
jgi:hypothetical protein